MTNPIPDEYRGWWRITETGTWVDDGLDILGPALLSLTGYGDRLRMHCLLADVNARATKTGVSFSPILTTPVKDACKFRCLRDHVDTNGRLTAGERGKRRRRAVDQSAIGRGVSRGRMSLS